MSPLFNLLDQGLNHTIYWLGLLNFYMCIAYNVKPKTVFVL